MNYVQQRAKNAILDSAENCEEIDDENLVGFLVADIINQVKKNKRNKCRFCKKGGAGTWCVSKRCKTVFHFNCGQKNDVQYKFYGDFTALCPKHYDLIDEEMIYKETPDLCLICDERMGEYHKLNLIRSCCKTNWYHRDCVAKTAYYQGKYLRFIFNKIIMS